MCVDAIDYLDSILISIKSCQLTYLILIYNHSKLSIFVYLFHFIETFYPLHSYKKYKAAQQKLKIMRVKTKIPEIITNLLNGKTYKMLSIDPAIKQNYLIKRCFKNGNYYKNSAICSIRIELTAIFKP